MPLVPRPLPLPLPRPLPRPRPFFFVDDLLEDREKAEFERDRALFERADLMDTRLEAFDEARLLLDVFELARLLDAALDDLEAPRDC